MQDLELYNPITLSVEKTIELNVLMAKSFVIFTQAAKERYGGFPHIKRLRNEYKKDRKILWSHPRASVAMRDMIAAEELLLRGNIKLGASMCSKMDKFSADRPGVTMGDYLQECASAIYDAQYMFDGRGKFSTYVTWAMRNRLITFIRSEEASGMGKDTIRLRAKCRKLMGDMSFDEAVEILRKTDDISPDSIKRLRDSMYRNSSISSDDDYGKADNEYEDHEDLYLAIEKAGLSDIQRKMVDAHMQGIKGFQTRMAETLINPSTGIHYTKSWLSFLFREACQKIATAYAPLEQKAA